MAKFTDFYTDTGGSNWVGKEEKAQLIADGTVLSVAAVRKGESKYGLRFVIDVELDGETRSISFPAGTVESRDRKLDALIEFLGLEDAEPVSIKLRKDGQSILVDTVE